MPAMFRRPNPRYRDDDKLTVDNHQQRSTFGASIQRGF
jgi:hypothetical protein